MKRLLMVLANAVGLDFLFLAVGTSCIAVGTSFIHPVGPWFVVGAMCLFVGIALALPVKRS